MLVSGLMRARRSLLFPATRWRNIVSSPGHEPRPDRVLKIVAPREPETEDVAFRKDRGLEILFPREEGMGLRARSQRPST
jgi:hypothetical protein